MSHIDQIDIDRARIALVGTQFAAHLHHFSTVSSTNLELLAEAAADAPDGTVFIADEQTAGRGRGNHGWHSAPGQGLYLSTLVRPALLLEDALLLSLATGLAVQRAILEVTTLELDLRWPNDLMLAAPTIAEQKKIGGILVETAVEPGPDPMLRHAVIGIGLNVHQESFPPELTPIASSLYLAEKARREDPEDVLPFFRGPLLISLLRSLDLELHDLERNIARSAHKGRARLIDRFTEGSTWIHDQRVTVSEQGGYTGTTDGLDHRGFLRVNGDDGQLHTVLSGGVRAL